jgi:transcriptional regulator with XRE-family HTH domain
MENLAERQKEALKLVEAILKVEPDHGTMAYARKMRERLKLPMSVVLEKLWPDLSILEKVEKLGVTRQAYYLWINGLARPSDRLSKRIAAQTGYDWKDIRGKVER